MPDASDKGRWRASEPDARHASEPASLEPMSEAQAHDLKVLSEVAFEPDAYKPHLTSAEAEQRIKALSAKLRLLDEPPHVL
jgi:hypothetical protein